MEIGKSMYTYFIISPGAEINSYVQYRGNVQGNYVKFGDAADLHSGAGIRQAYLTHNPDIGVAAVMDSSVFGNPYLGTRIKKYINTRGYYNVGNSEWFSITTQNAWGLFAKMQAWDNRVLNAGDQATLQTAIAPFFP